MTDADSPRQEDIRFRETKRLRRSFSLTMRTLLSIALCASALFLTPVFAQEGDALRGKIREIEERARTAKEQGRHEEANKLMAQAKQLRMEAGEGGKQRDGGDKNEMVKRRIEELRKEGKQEEADQLEARWRASMEKRGDEKKPGGEMDRMQHMKQAIMHLHAAGLHEEAERVEQIFREEMAKAEAGERERRKDGDKRSPKDAGPREPGEQKQHAVREKEEQDQRALREAHEQIAKLARSVEELREQVARQRAEGARRRD